MSVYCIDTSALIAAWAERYPIEHFPPFWDALAKLIEAGNMIAPKEVEIECGKKSDELAAWLKPFNRMFIEPDENIQLRVAALLTKFPRLVAERKNRTSADPFVIGLAIERGAIIITEEKPTRSSARPNIPDVIADEAFAASHIDLLALIRAEKWIFK